MKDLKISIPEPCAKDWNKMSPAENGRFCSSCNKIVVDFTSMSDVQILDYFKMYTGQKVCGSFRQSQLSHGKFKTSLLNLRTKIQGIQISPLRFAALIFLGGLMTLVGCEQKTTGEPAIETESNGQLISKDTLLKQNQPEDTSVIGKAVPQKERGKDSVSIKTDSSLKGKSVNLRKIESGRFITGEIAVEIKDASKMKCIQLQEK